MSSIASGTTTTTGLVYTSDTSGVLQLQTNGTTTAVTIDTAQNVGVGVTPSAWSGGKAIEVGSLGSGVWCFGVGQLKLTENAYYNSAYKYANTGYGAALYGLSNGVHVWSIAASGTAGTNISFTDAMTLDNSGNLNMSGGGYVGNQSNSSGIYFGSNCVLPSTGTALSDNSKSMGNASWRWSVIYAGTGTINTSDANQKQDIAVLDDAEKRVAVAIKSLIKKYRFKDAVAKKGDAARIHVGAVAQEVAAAFVAQGLDPTRYSIFCSDTWYEVDGKTSEDLTNPYTAKTEGAVEVTQLGLRYDELFAFVIAAL